MGDLDSIDKWSKYAIKPLTQGAIASGLSVAFHGTAPSLELFGTDVPLWMLSGGVVAAGGVFQAYAHDHLWNHLPLPTVTSAPVTTAANIGINLGASTLLYNLAAPGSIGMVEGVGTLGFPELVMGSVIAEVASGYIVENFIKPMLHKRLV